MSNLIDGNQSWLSLTLKEQAKVKLELISADGKSTETIINNQKLSGNQQIDIKTNTLSSGIYFLKIQIDEDVIVEKMVII